MARVELEILGDIVGRERITSTEGHLKAVQDWGVIEDCSAMRRFLGNFQWIRKVMPLESVVALPLLTKQLRKGATWPMDAEQMKAKRALQKLACKAIGLYSLDITAAISGERPCYQVADWSGSGWGGSICQLDAGGRALRVIGQYSGLSTLSQLFWHPRRGELYAQRQVRRAARKHIGRLPTPCYTDHAALIADVKTPDADYTTIRWIGDIESDGSRLYNISGRSCLLGDGPSRAHPEHVAELRRQATRLRNAKVDDLADSDREEGELDTWSIPSSALPEPPAAAAAGSSGRNVRCLVLVLPRNSSEARRDRDEEWLQRHLEPTVPYVSFGLVRALPPLPNDSLGDVYFDALLGHQLKSTKACHVCGQQCDAWCYNTRSGCSSECYGACILGKGHSGHHLREEHEEKDVPPTPLVEQTE